MFFTFPDRMVRTAFWRCEGTTARIAIPDRMVCSALMLRRNDDAGRSILCGNVWSTGIWNYSNMDVHPIFTFTYKGALNSSHLISVESGNASTVWLETWIPKRLQYIYGHSGIRRQKYGISLLSLLSGNVMSLLSANVQTVNMNTQNVPYTLTDRNGNRHQWDGYYLISLCL